MLCFNDFIFYNHMIIRLFYLMVFYASLKWRELMSLLLSESDAESHYINLPALVFLNDNVMREM